LRAPSPFSALGETLGVIEHIVSFWRFRFPDAAACSMTPDALEDIFKDFENGLGLRSESRPLLRTPKIIVAALTAQGPYAAALGRALTRACQPPSFVSAGSSGRPIQVAKSTVDSAQMSAIE
jgi:hypothetical protein